MTTWTDEVAKRIGRAIREARGDARTAQWLADRTRELGQPISRTAISEYETGKRKTMPVTDLTVIAAALDMPPALLLYPNQPDGAVEVLPGFETSSLEATQWFSGGVALHTEDPEAVARQQVHVEALARALALKNLRHDLDHAERLEWFMRHGKRITEGGRDRAVTDEDRQAASRHVAALREQVSRAEAGPWPAGWIVDGASDA